MPVATFDAEKIKRLPTDTRKKYFEEIGVNCSSATDLDTAIKVSGLNFNVAKYPVSYKKEYLEHNAAINDDEVKAAYIEVPNQYATVREDTGEALGVVGKNYNILQNIDAFDFLDSIIAGGNAEFDTAGVYGANSAKSFITVKTDGIKILDDPFESYLLIMNSFDGSGSVRVMFTPIRVWCSNTLMRAIKGAQNKVSIKHCSTLYKKLEVAKEVLLQNTNYLNALKKEAESLAVKPFTRDAYLEMIKKLNPVNIDSKHIEVELERNAQIIDQLTKAYDQTDLNNFAGTAWRAIQALSDYESHKPIFRQTSQAKFAAINSVVDGMPLTNLSYDYIMDYI